ncbi:glycosyltransferase family 4 protein [Parablastomonas sp. CN1-191]|uniref:glycosyltransferase family 4 protein n=1 Tax=Parablastomonas sp. CN1-191 TaxID=3400908 RepID=UPI003BF82D54
MSAGRLKILVADYSGHPFQVQLSRALAARGHTVRHMHFAGFQTPKGKLLRAADDPVTFDVIPITLEKPFAKDSFVRRRSQEIEVGKRFAAALARFKPDVVISSNAPLDTQRVFQRAARKAGARFIYWLQDIYSHAIAKVVPAKFPVIGHAAAAWYRHLEARMLRASDAVVPITADFVPILTDWGVDPARIAVAENWAPLDEIPPMPRDNAWAGANYPAQGTRFVYSGTLGYKHNPEWLLALARHRPESSVTVFSQGEVAGKLAADGADAPNLSVRDWVPFADLPAMLGGADVVIAVIEPEAGIYSVPSKILTYLAAGRPILAAMPAENLAARLIEEHEAGLVCAGNTREFLALADRLANDAALRQGMGANGRAYAERAFAIDAIADRFEDIIARATGAAS